MAQPKPRGQIQGRYSFQARYSCTVELYGQRAAHAAPGPVGPRNALWRPRLRFEALCAWTPCSHCGGHDRVSGAPNIQTGYRLLGARRGRHHRRGKTCWPNACPHAPRRAREGEGRAGSVSKRPLRICVPRTARLARSQVPRRAPRAIQDSDGVFVPWRAAASASTRTRSA